MAPQDFFKKYAPLAENTQIKYGVPASITLAQAALESAWGESSLTKSHKNFFGIKADASWKGASATMRTIENVAGQNQTQLAKFRIYPTAQDGFDDHGKFLVVNKRYASLFKLPVTDFVNWANGLKAAGYVTDPNYASKLISIINKYNLQQYDDRAIKKKRLEP